MSDAILPSLESWIPCLVRILCYPLIDVFQHHLVVRRIHQRSVNQLCIRRLAWLALTLALAIHGDGTFKSPEVALQLCVSWRPQV